MSFSEWKSETLDNLCLQIADCPHSTPKWTDSGVFVIRSWNVRNGVLNADKVSFTTEAIYLDRIKRAIPIAGDIVITREAPMGEVAMIPEGLKCCLGQRLVLLRPNSEKVDNQFLLYSLQSSFVQAQILSNEGTGSTVSNLRIPDLKNLKIPTPKKDLQKRIASILSSLDDKIALNQQMAQTLEAMAQALFKEMCLPKGDELPDGWWIGKLGDIMTLQRGFDLPTTTRTHGKYPVIAASGLNGYHNEFKNFAPGVTTGRSGVIGNVFYIQDDFWALNTSLFVKEFKVGQPIYSYFVLRSIDLAIHNGGSAVPTLNRNHVHEIKVIVPPLQIIDAFSTQAIAMYQEINNTEKETQTLISLRDGLLPKLMKGEIIPYHNN